MVLLTEEVPYSSANLYRTHLHHQEDFMQATSIQIADEYGALIVSAIYCPPQHSVQTQQFQQYFSSLGAHFIAGGDYNNKHHIGDQE